MLVPCADSGVWQCVSLASAVRGGKEHSLPDPPVLQGLCTVRVQLLHMHNTKGSLMLELDAFPAPYHTGRRTPCGSEGWDPPPLLEESWDLHSRGWGSQLAPMRGFPQCGTRAEAAHGLHRALVIEASQIIILTTFTQLLPNPYL